MNHRKSVLITSSFHTDYVTSPYRWRHQFQQITSSVPIQITSSVPIQITSSITAIQDHHALCGRISEVKTMMANGRGTSIYNLDWVVHFAYCGQLWLTRREVCSLGYGWYHPDTQVGPQSKPFGRELSVSRFWTILSYWGRLQWSVLKDFNPTFKDLIYRT